MLMPGIEHDETPYDADTEEGPRPALVTSAAPPIPVQLPGR